MEGGKESRMSAVIDEKVVEMRFDNKQFESAAGDSLKTIDQLNKALKNTSGTTTDVDKLAKSINNTDISGISTAVESLQKRFSTLGIVGMQVIENITNGILGKLTGAVKSLANQIVSGGIKRAMNIENARFQLQGLISDEKEVEAVMADAADSVDGTAYSYDSAAKAASMFAATGLRSGEQMQRALKAIAGVAATTNSDYESMSEIFTTIAGQGRVMGMQLTQLATRGMNAAASLKEYFNQVNSGQVEVSDKAKKMVQDITTSTNITEAEIRDMVSKGKISFEVFSEAMATTFGDHAKDANKTFTGAMSNIRAALSRTGAMFVQDIIRQEGEAVKLFNTIRVKINDMNKALKPFAENSVRIVKEFIKNLTSVVEKVDMYRIISIVTNALDSLFNVLKGIGSILKPIGEAFAEVFHIDLQALNRASYSLWEFTRRLKITDENAENIKATFKGLFDFIKMLGTLFVRLINAILPGTKALGSFGEVILQLTGNFGRLLSKFSEFVLESQTIKDIFDGIHFVFEKAAEGIGKFFGNLREGMKMDTSWFDRIKEKFQGMESPLEKFQQIGSSLFKGIKNFFEPVINTLKELGKAIWDVLTSTNPMKAFIAFLNSKLFTGIVGTFTELVNTLTKTLINTVLASMSNFFLQLGAMVASMKNLDRTIDILKGLGIALLELAAAMYIISSIDSKKLVAATAAVSVLMFELVTAFETIMQLSASARTRLKFDFKEKTFGMWESISAELMSIALAVLALSAAVTVLANLDPDRLIQGMIGVTVILGELVAVIEILDHTTTGGKLAGVGATLIGISVGLLVLTSAVKKLGDMDLEQLGKGLVAVGVLLAEMTLALKFMPKSGAVSAIGAIELALSLVLVASTLKILSTIDMDDLYNSVVMMGLVLLEMTLALKFMPMTGAISALGAIEMAIAFVGIAVSLKILATLDTDSMYAAAVTIGLILLEMTASLLLIPIWAPLTALAAIEMAAAFIGIAVSLKILGSMDVDKMKKATGTIGLILLEMVASLWGIPIWAPLTALAAIEMAASFVEIAGALKILGTIDSMRLEDGVEAIGECLKSMTSTLWKMPLWAPTAALAAIEMAVSYNEIAASLKILSTVPTETLQPSVEAIGGALVAMTRVLWLIPITAPISALAAIEMATAFVIIAEALKELQQVDLEKAQDGMVALKEALGIMMIVLGAMGVSAPVVIAGAVALTAVGVAVATAVAFLVPAIDDLITCIKQMEDIDPDSFGVNIALVASALVMLGESLKSFNLLAVGSAFAVLEVAEAIAILAPALTELSVINPKVLLILFDNLSLGIIKLGNALKSYDLLDIVRGGAFLEMAAGIRAMAGGLAQLARCDSGKLDNMFNDLARGIANFGDAIKHFNILDFIKAGAFQKLAEAIGVLVPALKDLQTIDTLKLGGMMTALGEGFKNFGEALKNAPFWGAKSRAESIGVLCEQITKLANVLPQFIQMDSWKVQKAMETLGEGFKNFGTSLSNAPFWGGKNRAESIGTLCDQIEKLTESLPKFMELDYEGVKKAMATLGVGFKMFGEDLKAAPFFNADDRGEGIKLLVESIGSLANGLKKFIDAEIDEDAFATSMTTISKAFVIFGQDLEYAPLFNAQERGEGIASLVDSIKTLAEGLVYWQDNVKGDDVASILDTVKEAFVGFGEALKGSPWFKVEERSEGMANMIGNVKSLADSMAYFLKAIGETDSMRVNAIMTSIKDSMLGFSEALKDSPWFKTSERADSLATVINSLDSLADCVARLANGVGVLAATSMLNGIAEGIGAIGQMLETNWDQINETMIEFVDKSADAIMKFMSINPETVTNVATAINSLYEALLKCSSMDGDGLSTFSETASTLVDNFLMAFNDSEGKVTEQITNFITAIVNIIKSDTNLVSLKNAGIESVKGFLEGFKSLQNTEVRVAVNIIVSSIVTGFSMAYQRLYSAGQNIARAITNGLMDSKSEFFVAGVYVAQGFIDGIQSKNNAAAWAGGELGRAALNAARAALGEESPSKEMFKVGAYATEGFILGLASLSEVVKKSSSDIGNTTLKAFNSSISKVNEAFNEDSLNPVITPEVNLENVYSSVDEMARLFNDSLLYSRTNTAGISTSVNSATFGKDNAINTAPNNNYIFTQNNYSPKALDRAEIYRQTRNQFSQIKQARA